MTHPQIQAHLPFPTLETYTHTTNKARKISMHEMVINAQQKAMNSTGSLINMI